MTTTKRRNVPDFSLIECAICKGLMTDPRALPCGHSFCGPPKTCLKGVERRDGLRCAVCKNTFNQKISELKPIFGIRDFLQQSTSNTTDDISFDVMCKDHGDEEVMFWCRWCQEKACQKCFDAKHQSHPLINFRRHLREKTGPLFWKVNSKMKQINSKADELSQSGSAEKVKSSVEKHIRELRIFETKWHHVEKFIENPNDDVNLNIIESFLGESFEDLDIISKQLGSIHASALPNFKFRSDFSFYLTKQSEQDLIRDIPSSLLIIGSFLCLGGVFFSTGVLPLMLLLMAFLLSPLVVVFRPSIDLFALREMYRDNSMIQKFTSRKLGSIIVPHKNSAEVKITVCHCDIKRKLHVTVSLAKFFRRNNILHNIPYMGNVQVNADLPFTRNLFIEGKLQDHRFGKTHELEIQLPELQEGKTMLLTVECSIFFDDEKSESYSTYIYNIHRIREHIGNIDVSLMLSSITSMMHKLHSEYRKL